MAKRIETQLITSYIAWSLLIACVKNSAFASNTADVFAGFYQNGQIATFSVQGHAVDTTQNRSSQTDFTRDFVLQPNIVYYLLLGGGDDSQTGYSGSGGARSSLDLTATLGPGASWPTTGGSNYVNLSVTGVPGQPDAFWNGNAPTIPVNLAQSIQVIGNTGTGSAAGLLSIALDGQTLTVKGLVGADSSCNTTYFSNRKADALFRSQIWFSVTTPTTLTLSGSIRTAVRGADQSFPQLPDPNNQFPNGTSGDWFDPALATGYEFRMIGSSLFTDILEFPTGIDADSQFEVWVGETSLGLFSVGQPVNFGAGVAEFRITGIGPAVDGSNPTAFPIRLAFNKPTASFTMTPLPAPVSLKIAPVSGQTGQFNVIFSPVIPGSTYSVETSPDLTPTSWVPLSGGISSDNGLMRTVKDLNASGPRKFYRVVVTPH